MAVETLLKYPVIFFSAFAITYLLTPLVEKAAGNLNIVDHPAARRINSNPVPRAGGLALFFGFHAGCAMIFLYPWLSFFGVLNTHWWLSFLLSSTFLLLIGLIDDLTSLRPLTKLAGQASAALLMFLWGYSVSRVLGVSLPLPVDLLTTMIWYLALINAFNLIDGLDGLASGIGAIAAVGIAGSMLFRHQPGDALVMISLCGACLAFLRFNFHPARIYLGDSGSMFLGFILASIALSAGAKGTVLASVGVPILAAGVPLFDTVLAVWRRSVSGLANHKQMRMMSADLDHLHHRLLRAGFAQSHVAFLLYSASCVLVAIGLLSLVFRLSAAGIFVLSFVVGAYIIVRHVAHVELWDSGVSILRGVRRPQARVLAVILYPILDWVLLMSSLALAIGMSLPGYNLERFKEDWFCSVPLWCGLPFLSMFVFHVYSRVWSRARISEFAVPGTALLAGVLMASGVSLLNTQASTGKTFLTATLYCCLSGLSLTAMRALPRIVEDLLAYVGADPRLRSGPPTATLIYGAGDRALLYLRQTALRVGRAPSTERIIGFIDDDTNLRKRLIHGFWVLGGFADLPQILSEKKVSRVVVACSLDQKLLNELAGLCHQNTITLVEWGAGFRALNLAGENAAGLPLPKPNSIRGNRRRRRIQRQRVRAA